MTKNTIIGVDLAKTVFQIAVMSDNKIKSNKRVNRKELRLFMTKHPEATVAMEACYSSHYWAREFERILQTWPSQEIHTIESKGIGRIERI